MNDTKLTSRAYLGTLLNNLGLTNNGVEIGVFEGVFSKQILSQWDGKKLYMVDVWREMPGYVDQSNQRNIYTATHCFTSAFKNTFEFGDRAVIVREESAKAASFFADGSLDFVYIDAAHDYDAVMADLITWYPKVKKGGLFSGHDFLDMDAGSNPWGEFKVKKAVLEFAAAKCVEISTTTEDGFPSWFVQL